MRNTALLLALSAALPAFAGDEEKPAPPQGAGLLKERDKDGDGRLSPEELGPDRQIFDLLDRDGDGFLTAEELPKPRRAKGEPGLKRDKFRKEAERFLRENDKDGDGKIGMSEWSISSRRLMDADRNGDQLVDLDEMTAFFAGKPARGPREGPEEGMPGDGPPPGDPPPGAPPGEGERPWVREMAAGILKRFDKDHDGRLAGDEIPQEGKVDLSKADRNGDGAIDLFEITLVLSERAGEGGGPDAGMLVRRLKEMDANQDGAIDKAEWKGPPERFDKVDADHDGRITEAEVKQAMKALGAGPGGDGRWMDKTADAAFRRFDKDGDGKIASEEWGGRPESFQRLDANHDGAITREELTPKGPGGGRKGGRPDVKSGKDSASFLDEYDKDRDGQVTKQEFPHERRFSEIDADGDGVLSNAEIRDAMDRMHNEKAYGVFERYDLNSDGKITREEFTGPAADFERIDKNHDGVIDKADGVPEKPEQPAEPKEPKDK